MFAPRSRPRSIVHALVTCGVVVFAVVAHGDPGLARTMDTPVGTASTKQPPKPQFFSASDRRPYRRIPGLMRDKGCFALGNELHVNPATSINRPDGRRRNRYARAWIDYPVRNKIQVLRTELRKGITVCFAFVETNDGRVYFLSKKAFVFRRTKRTKRVTARYIDPYTKASGEPSIRTATVFYRRKR